MTALELKREFGVVDAQATEDGGLQVVRMHGILRDVVAVIVCGAERDARLDAAAGDPHGEAAAVMIAPIVSGSEAALAVNGAAEFTAPNDQSIV